MELLLELKPLGASGAPLESAIPTFLKMPSSVLLGYSRHRLKWRYSARDVTVVECSCSSFGMSEAERFVLSRKATRKSSLRVFFFSVFGSSGLQLRVLDRSYKKYHRF